MNQIKFDKSDQILQDNEYDLLRASTPEKDRKIKQKKLKKLKDVCFNNYKINWNY